MSATAAIRQMLSDGLTIEQALIAVEAMESAKKAGVKSNAQRQAEWRARQKQARNENNVSNVTCVTPVTEPANAPVSAHAELEPKNLEPSYPKTPLKGGKKGEVSVIAKPSSERSRIIECLSTVVTPERAEAIIDHRAKLRKPITLYAAQQLAKSLSAAPDPNAAADTMIERGWQAWRPDWGQGSRGPPGGAAKTNSGLDGVHELRRMLNDAPPQQPRLRLAN